MVRDDVQKLISRMEDEFFFTGGVSNELIHTVEEELNVVLPESYKWFLSKYGYGGINGIMIQGVGLNNSLQVVKYTKSLRKFGLSDDLVMIESVDEYIYCLDTSQMNENECPVIDWDQSVGKGNINYKNFYEYLYDRFTDAIENL